MATVQSLTSIKSRLDKEINLCSEKYRFLISEKEHLVIQNRSIGLLNKPTIRKGPHDSYYSNNKNSFVFKLFDHSIIQASYTFDDNNKLTQHRFVYVSPSYDDRAYDLMSYENQSKKLYRKKIAVNGDIELTNPIELIKRKVLDQYLDNKLSKKYSDTSSIRETVNELLLNPLVLRIDFDVEPKPNHPFVHFTVNNISTSRLKVSREVGLLDFLEFVLNFVYGLVSNDSNYLQIIE